MSKKGLKKVYILLLFFLLLSISYLSLHFYTNSRYKSEILDNLGSVTFLDSSIYINDSFNCVYDYYLEYNNLKFKISYERDLFSFKLCSIESTYDESLYLKMLKDMGSLSVTPNEKSILTLSPLGLSLAYTLTSIEDVEESLLLYCDIFDYFEIYFLDSRLYSSFSYILRYKTLDDFIFMDGYSLNNKLDIQDLDITLESSKITQKIIYNLKYNFLFDKSNFNKISEFLDVSAFIDLESLSNVSKTVTVKDTKLINFNLINNENNLICSIPIEKSNYSFADYAFSPIFAFYNLEDDSYYVSVDNIYNFLKEIEKSELNIDIRYLYPNINNGFDIKLILADKTTLFLDLDTNLGLKYIRNGKEGILSGKSYILIDVTDNLKSFYDNLKSFYDERSKSYKTVSFYDSNWIKCEDFFELLSLKLDI